MATTAASTAAAETLSDGPVLNLMSKRLRALRKKFNRITQMEEALAQGKTLNREQEEVLRSKPAVLTLIDEYEKLRAPLSAAVAEELSRHSASPSAPPPSLDVSDLVGLLYFGRLFDVQPQSDFTATMLTRTHERGCCLTYDYVTDDAVELLGERDLDEISALGALVTARPASATVSHKNALQGCVEHARLWLEHADQPIHPGASVTYAMLREKLRKIMASDYCTATPEMKAPDDVAAAVGKYNNACQAPVPEPTEPPTSEVQVDVQVDDYTTSYEEKEDAEENDQETEVAPDQSSESSRADEPPNEESDVLNPAVDDIIGEQPEQQNQEADQEQSPRDTEPKEQQFIPRRSYPNQRGGNRGGGGFGGRRGFPNGRGGRGGRGGGGGGGAYQNGRNQYYDNGYQRNYFNPRGRGGGRFSGGSYHGGPPTHAGLVPAYAE